MNILNFLPLLLLLISTSCSKGSRNSLAKKIVDPLIPDSRTEPPRKPIEVAGFECEASTQNEKKSIFMTKQANGKNYDIHFYDFISSTEITRMGMNLDGVRFISGARIDPKGDVYEGKLFANFIDNSDESDSGTRKIPSCPVVLEKDGSLSLSLYVTITDSTGNSTDTEPVNFAKITDCRQKIALQATP